MSVRSHPASRVTETVRAMLAALLFLMGGALTLRAEAGNLLHPPFDLPEPAATGKQSDCPNAPPPVITFDADSIYADGDATRSTIDPAAKAAYEASVRPLRLFGQGVSRMANRYVKSRGADVGAAACVIDWLAAWARGGALSQIASRQAALSLTRVLSTVGLAYVQARVGVANDPSLAAVMADQIDPWMQRLGRETVAVYDGQRRSDLGNHRYWGGLAAAAIAIATQDRPLFDWAMKSYEVGACQIDPQGALPIELTRGPRSRDYHIHAAAPLVMLAEIGERNGRDEYGVCDGALHRLVRFILEAVIDPARINALAGAEQLPLKQLENRLAWIAIYRSRFALPVAIPLPEDLGATTLGGSVRMLYGG